MLYKFTTTAVGGLDSRVAIEFTHSSGDLDLELLDADRIPIRRSATINNVEQVSLNEFVPGTYYVRVFGYGSATNTFSLTIEAPAGDIPQDAYEANNQLENASNLGTLQGVNEYGQLTIHNSDDRDFYKFTTAATGRADDSIRLNFVHARGDLDVRLRNSSGVVIASSSSVRDFEEISLKGLRLIRIRWKCMVSRDKPASVQFASTSSSGNRRAGSFRAQQCARASRLSSGSAGQGCVFQFDFTFHYRS